MLLSSTVMLAHSWADAAIIWLATDLEQRAERDSLAAAMAVSLRQVQQPLSSPPPSLLLGMGDLALPGKLMLG